ncbi:MAG: YhjD/YihY/BrkB family envelope integrity protein [Candidatus Limnocylindrales bacterium]
MIDPPPPPPARFGWLRDRATSVLAQPAIAAGLRILDRYNAGGGGLLAGGLAYAALFAIVPGLLLLAGVVGLLFADPVERAHAVAVVVGVLPPLHDVIEAVLAEAARSAAPVSIVGAVVLVWGTSRFVVAFEDAIARVMGGDRRRGMITSNLAALASVILMIGAIVLSTLLSGLLAFLEAGAQSGAVRVVGDLLGLALGVLPIAITVAATMLVYRIVPIPAPPWRAVVVPGIAAGVALTVLASIFVFVAPRLIGAAAFIGALATAFAALAWLGLSFQALLFGAAWVRDRATRLTPPGARSDLH